MKKKKNIIEAHIDVNDRYVKLNVLNDKKGTATNVFIYSCHNTRSTCIIPHTQMFQTHFMTIIFMLLLWKNLIF